jgi:hypothetical protein
VNQITRMSTIQEVEAIRLDPAPDVVRNHIVKRVRVTESGRSVLSSFSALFSPSVGSRRI